MIMAGPNSVAVAVVEPFPGLMRRGPSPFALDDAAAEHAHGSGLPM